MSPHRGPRSAPNSLGAGRAPAHRRRSGGARAARPLGAEQLEARLLLAAGHDAPAWVRAASEHASVFKNIVYEEVPGDEQTLDLYLPKGTPPSGGWPVLLAIHGGGWRRFSKNEYGPQVAGMFVPDGIAVVAMNYTLSAPGAPSWPTNFEDVRNAVRWARANAPAFDLDPNHFAAIGESAGGHLAALLGTDPNGPLASVGDSALGAAYGSVSAQVQAVVDFYGPTDLAALQEQSREAAPAVVQFLGGTPSELPQTYAEASPDDHVTPASAPMLILQGTADTLIPLDQAESLAAELSQDGVPNRLIIVPGAPHGFEFQPSGRKLAPVILAFLRALWQG